MSREVQLRLEYLEGRYDSVHGVAAEWAKEVSRLLAKGWPSTATYVRLCRQKRQDADAKANEIAREIIELSEFIEKGEPELDEEDARLAYKRGYRFDPVECRNCGADSYDGFCTEACRLAWAQVHDGAFVEGHPRDTSADRFERDKVGEQQ